MANTTQLARRRELRKLEAKRDELIIKRDSAAKQLSEVRQALISKRKEK